MELLRLRQMIVATQPSSSCTEAKAVTAMQRRQSLNASLAKALRLLRSIISLGI